MKKTILFMAAVMILFAVCIFVPAQSPTLAAIADFDITYTVNPELVGYLGADMQLLISVQNKGTTPITWIEVDVFTSTPFNERRNLTIAPGTTRHNILFVVPFEEGDLNRDTLLFVAMNNDGDTNSDGVQVRTFSVTGTRNIMDVGWRYTPGWEFFMTGDTISITHTFRNPFATHAQTGLETRTLLTLDGVRIYMSPIQSHGALFPGASVSDTLLYTFAESDIGHMRISHAAEFTLMGKDYLVNMWSFEFDVFDSTPDIEFTAHLSASPSTIEAGDEVTYTVSFENTGDHDIYEFEIRNSEGGVEAAAGLLAPGATDSVVLSANIFESTDVSFVVIGSAASTTESEETNTVRITVREPEESPSPTVTEVLAAAATVTAAPTALPTVTLTPAMTDAAQTSISPDEEKEAAAQPEPIENLALYIIIGALGLLVIAGGITVPILLHKNKKKGGGKRKDKL